MKKVAGLLLLGMAACSEGPSVTIESGRLAVEPEYQALVGGRECTAKAIRIVLGRGMSADLSCPKGEFRAVMECSGFSMPNGVAQCPPGKKMEVTLEKK